MFTALSAMLTGGAHLAAAVTALPLSLSMGVAEWLLYRYRHRTAELARGSAGLTGFSWRARRALLGSVAGYLSVLAAIADLVSWSGQATGAFTVTPGLFWTAVALGGALFVALALRCCGVTGVVLAACSLAFCGELAAVVAAPLLGRRPDAELVQLVACAGLFAVLLPYAVVVLGRATRHR
jgi:hypothetical protein